MSKREADKRHLTDLTHPTDSTVIKSYVKNRPMLCKRRDIGSNELVGMKINQEDLDIINKVKEPYPKYSPSFKKQKKQPMNPHGVNAYRLRNIIRTNKVSNVNQKSNQ